MITPVKKKVKRRIAKTAPAETKAKEKKEELEEGPEHEGAELIAGALQKIQIANEMAMKMLRDEIKKIKFSTPTPPIEWIFDIVRDADTGLIRQIKASVPKEKRTLN